MLFRQEKIIFSLLLSLGVFFLGSIVYAWTSPASNPPNGNVSAPINAGSGSQTKSGALTVTQLTASIANGTAPLVVTSQTKVANLNADLLDGLDASGFGDATAANQTTILGRIGTSGDGAGTGSLFAHAARIYNQVDSTYTAAYVKGTDSLGGCGSAPSCAGGWSAIDSFCLSTNQFPGGNGLFWHYTVCALPR